MLVFFFAWIEEGGHGGVVAGWVVVWVEDIEGGEDPGIGGVWVVIGDEVKRGGKGTGQGKGTHVE